MTMKSKNCRTTSGRRRPRKEEAVVFDPGRHSLSYINGSINKMAVKELKQRLEHLHLNSSGVPEVLKKRLKSYYKELKLPSFSIEGQYYPFMIVVDFEATCEETNSIDYIHEIIEFPAVLIDTSTLTVVDEFHSYCRPTLSPTLSDFCKRLTGIEQRQVDSAPYFSTVLENFNSWLWERNLGFKGKCAFVTDGCWDFSKFLNIQCCLSEVSYPKWARQWMNIKKLYANFYKLKQPKIMDMLANVGLEFEGRLHCGMDDARNLARILIRLMEDGAKPQMNEKLINGRLIYIREEERCSLAAKQVRRHNLKTLASARDTTENDDVRDESSTSTETMDDVEKLTREVGDLRVSKGGETVDHHSC